MSKLILDSLDEKRLAVFEKLNAFKDLGVLGSGTALSLQISHRISYDFDVFTHDKLGKDLWRMVKKVYGKECKKLLDTKDQLNLTTPQAVKVTFFYDDYKPIFKPIQQEVINLFDIRDIATNKAYTLGRRPKWRDYIDLYFLLKNGYIKLEKLIELSQKKFGSDFAKRLFLQQLVYWGDVKNYKIEFLRDEVPPNQIKSFLKKEVKKYKKRKL